MVHTLNNKLYRAVAVTTAESEEDMIENIKGYKLIKFNIGYDVYLLKGKGICKEFESKDKALEYLEFFISIN